MTEIVTFGAACHFDLCLVFPKQGRTDNQISSILFFWRENADNTRIARTTARINAIFMKIVS